MNPGLMDDDYLALNENPVALDDDYLSTWSMIMIRMKKLKAVKSKTRNHKVDQKDHDLYRRMLLVSQVFIVQQENPRTRQKTTGHVRLFSEFLESKGETMGPK